MRSAAVTALLLVVLASAAAQDPSQNARVAERLLFDGIARFERRDLAGAMPLFERARELIPGDPRPYFFLAQCEFNLWLGDGDPDRVDRIYAYADQGVAARPRFGGCHFVIGLLGMKLGRFPQAARAFHLAQEYGFEVRVSRQNLALTLLLWGEWIVREGTASMAEARAILEDARDRFDVLRNDVRYSDEDRASFRENWIRALTALAVVHQEAEERDQAEAILKHLTLVDPGNHLHWLNLGKVYGSYFRWEEAIAAHRKALELKDDPRWAEPHLRIASILSSLSQFEEAEEEFQACFGREVDRWELEYRYGRHLGRQRDLEGAVDHYLAAIAVDPLQREPYFYLHQALLQLRRPAEAVKWQLVQQALEERESAGVEVPAPPDDRGR